jgi:hypothetical protein
VYWGTDVIGGKRIAVGERPQGWRGNMYALYVLSPDVTVAQLGADLDQPNRRYTPVLDGQWRPPLVFWSTATDGPWFIDAYDMYEIDGHWDVYLPGSDFKLACTITFWPEERDVIAPRALPKEARDFAWLLDQTLGFAPEDGTLQSTAHLRLRTQHLWKNVAYRPWAISGALPYNARAQVDDGLRAWSRNGASFAKLHARIQRAYPLAERALARYYEREFKLSEPQSIQAARWVLDVAYRANFVFPDGSRDDEANTTPWPG